MKADALEANPWLVREKQHVVALLALPSMTSRRLREMLALFGSPAGAWDAVARGSARAPEEDADWRGTAAASDPTRISRDLEAASIAVVVRGEREYPRLLASIHDPPVALFIRGSLPDNECCVAIVGSRKATPYGTEAARWLSEGLAREGACVVSGAANGIDTAAHLGALQGGGTTLAVLGCGVDIAYPRSNARLLEKIAAEGAVVSEYFPGTEPRPFRFPERNRIVAGLSRMTIVVEASERSGALITADFALEEGREVMAVPGQVFSPNSRGCHDLIRSGAALAGRVEDVLEGLGWSASESETLPLAPDGLASEQGAALLAALRGGPLDAEGLALMTRQTVSSTLAALTALEIRGLVLRAPGGLFQRARTAT